MIFDGVWIGSVHEYKFGLLSTRKEKKRCARACQRELKTTFRHLNCNLSDNTDKASNAFV